MATFRVRTSKFDSGEHVILNCMIQVLDCCQDSEYERRNSVSEFCQGKLLSAR